MKKVQTRTRTKRNDENSNVKVAKTKSAPRERAKRMALVDCTNSGSDLNPSSPSPEASKPVSHVKSTPAPARRGPRPKRIHVMPSRFQDHELSPVHRPKNDKQFASTPIDPQTSGKRSSKMVCKLSPVAEPEPVVSSKSPMVCDPVNKTPSKEPRIAKVTPQPVRPKRVLRNDKKSPKEPPTTKRIAKVLVKTPKKSVNPKNQIPDSRPAKTTIPIYKTQSVVADFEGDKLALYDFEFRCENENEPATAKKKKVKKNNPTKKRKVMSRKSTDAAMKMLIEDLKKIREEKMMKNLLAKIKSKKANAEKPKIATEKNVRPQEVVQCDVSNDDDVPLQYEDSVSNEDLADNLPPSPMHCDNDDVDNVSPANNHTINFSHPVASSSMINTSKSFGSPWRMDLDSDVRKWRYNFYVKPSMTPAYERDTFHVIGLDDNDNNKNTKEKDDHVSSMPNIEEAKRLQTSSKFKQTSILSFYEESFQRKSPRKRVASPKKRAKPYNFDEYLPASPQTVPNDSEIVKEVVPVEDQNAEQNYQNAEPDIENCFGFEDQDVDQENIVPVKSNKTKSLKKTLLKIQGKAPVLKEIHNVPKAPTRVTRKQVQKILAFKDQKATKEAAAAVVAIEKEVSTPNTETVNLSQNNDDSDESVTNTQNSNSIEESVNDEDCPLFEDPVEVEIVHHIKPTRRSYDRQRKAPVRFQFPEGYDENKDTSDEDSSERVHYVVSAKTVKKRKTKKIPKKLMSRKEVKEADEWAAGFNSMLDEAEEFPLCIDNEIDGED